MNKVFIDIETIPTQNESWIKELKDTVQPPATHKKPETIAKWMEENGVAAGEELVAKTSFNGGMGQIFCTGLKVTNPIIITRGDLSPESERMMLVEFNEVMAEVVSRTYKQPHFIGHNISGFDLPFLLHRMIVHKVKPGFVLPAHDAVWKGSYTDTMALWVGNGRVSLDSLCKYLGIESPKTELDGSKVWEYVKAGKYKEVQDYCLQDVQAIESVYKRLTFTE